MPETTEGGSKTKVTKPRRASKDGSVPLKKKSPSTPENNSGSSTKGSAKASKGRRATNDTKSTVVVRCCSCQKHGDQSQSTMSKAFIGKPAPTFKAQAVVDGDFKEVSLADYRGKYVLLFFYPADFTFVCPTEIIAFSERSDEFEKIGCSVLACSTDSHFSHLAWIQQPRKQGGLGEMKIPVIADRTQVIAREYGVLKEEDGVAFRGLFIIDGKGTLRQMTINDLPVGRDVDEALRLVQAFKYTDEHGEVCPAGWRPGKATMKPSPKESKNYFEKAN